MASFDILDQFYNPEKHPKKSTNLFWWFGKNKSFYYGSTINSILSYYNIKNEDSEKLKQPASTEKKATSKSSNNNGTHNSAYDYLKWKKNKEKINILAPETQNNLPSNEKSPKNQSLQIKANFSDSHLVDIPLNSPTGLELHTSNPAKDPNFMSNHTNTNKNSAQTSGSKAKFGFFDSSSFDFQSKKCLSTLGYPCLPNRLNFINLESINSFNLAQSNCSRHNQKGGDCKPWTSTIKSYFTFSKAKEPIPLKNEKREQSSIYTIVPLCKEAPQERNGSKKRLEPPKLNINKLLRKMDTHGTYKNFEKKRARKGYLGRLYKNRNVNKPALTRVNNNQVNELGLSSTNAAQLPPPPPEYLLKILESENELYRTKMEYGDQGNQECPGHVRKREDSLSTLNSEKDSYINLSQSQLPARFSEFNQENLKLISTQQNDSAPNLDNIDLASNSSEDFVLYYQPNHLSFSENHHRVKTLYKQNLDVYGFS
ncbi:hypothetical protein BB560_000450 [Smittium megazygosporum]|uniref:Uncharacterized protein n=1 Tax=Smittium megazygosporum TaxID=133381 RepID=A0A2T9ZKE2_9FUNG|nr:hypothetical protein BB560_000450 [Smittium megazygosporum]